MADYLESTVDAPSTPTDSKSSKSLIDEVNGDRDNKSSVLSKIGFDKSTEDKIKDVFGSLTLVDDSSQAVKPKDVAASFSFGDPSDDDKKAMRDFVQKVREKVDESMYPEKKAQLDKDVDQIKDDKTKEQFKKDIDTFEHRTPPVSTAEKERFYHEMTRLLEAKDNPGSPLTAADRERLAGQLMHKAADPTSIDQGRQGTCNVATVESRTFTRDPSDAAKMVVDVATTGEYVAKDGTHVKIDPRDIKPDIETQNPGGYFKNPRDHADQLFQITAVNTAWQKSDLTVQNLDGSYKTIKAGNIEYRQTDPTTGDPIGEGLYDKSKNPPERIQENGKNIDHPHINANQMTDLGNLISGKEEKGFVLEHGGAGSAEKTFKVNSEQELKDKLKDMKEKGELPAIIVVNTGNSPFWGENVSTSPGFIPKSGSGGEHVVTITDYDPKTGAVSMDNQWGKGRDHIGGSAISTGDLYLATMPPGNSETIGILERDVKWNRDHNTVNTFKELELLRQKNEGGKLNDDEYLKQVEQVMKDAHARWDKNHTPETDVERLQGEEQYAKIQSSKKKIHMIHMGGN